MNEEAFKDILSKIANSVAVLITENKTGVIGCTVSSCLAIDVQNPKIGLLLKNNSYFGNAILDSRYVSVNYVTAKQVAIAQHYADPLRGNSDHGDWFDIGRNKEIVIAKSAFSLVASFHRLIEFENSNLYVFNVKDWYCTDNDILIYQNRKFQV